MTPSHPDSTPKENIKFFVFGYYSDSPPEVDKGYSAAVRGFDTLHEAEIFRDGLKAGGGNGFHSAVVVPFHIGVDKAAEVK
jgi:hypothetical protein